MKKKILILAGGYSREREISLETAKSVYKELVKNNRLIIDGSHNENGSRSLNNYLQSLNCNKHIIVGMMKNKEHERYTGYFKNISSITTIDLKTQTTSDLEFGNNFNF